MSNNKKPLWGNRGKHHEMSIFGKKRSVRRVIGAPQPPIPVRQPLNISEQKETVEYIIGNTADEEATRLKSEEEARLKAEEDEARLKAEEEARLKAEEEEWQRNNLTPEEIEANRRYKAEEEETARLLALQEQEDNSEPVIEDVYEEKSVSPGENLLSSNKDELEQVENIKV